MARSPAVWVVIGTTAVPIAAFTVKHELCTWLWKFQTPQTLDHLHGWKVTDGVRHWLGTERGGPWPLDLLYLREEGRKAEEAQQNLRDWRG